MSSNKPEIPTTMSDEVKFAHDRAVSRMFDTLRTMNDNMHKDVSPQEIQSLLSTIYQATFNAYLNFPARTYWSPGRPEILHG